MGCVLSVVVYYLDGTTVLLRIETRNCTATPVPVHTRDTITLSPFITITINNIHFRHQYPPPFMTVSKCSKRSPRNHGSPHPSRLSTFPRHNDPRSRTLSISFATADTLTPLNNPLLLVLLFAHLQTLQQSPHLPMLSARAICRHSDPPTTLTTGAKVPRKILRAKRNIGTCKRSQDSNTF